MPRKFTRRIYETTALVACREVRELVLFWTRRGRKSTTLGSISFDEMSGTPGRTVIAASALLLLGKELVGMTVGAAEQAAIVTREASAIRQVFENGTDAKDGTDGAEKLDLKVANANTDKVYGALSEQDFAELYQSSSMEMRLYFDRTRYSRLKIIAPNPATARGWGGTVLRDEAGYTPANLENELRIATKPIMDTDPTFKLIYASNLCRDDKHPFFKMTLPRELAEADLPVSPAGNFYRGQDGILVHRVTLADAYSAGHVLFDDKGKALTLGEFRKQPGNALGYNINYALQHESGGTAAIDLMSLITAQQRGRGNCDFVFVDGEEDYLRALRLLRENLGGGDVGGGIDVGTTTKETSNPTTITVTEKSGAERAQRLVIAFKSKKREVRDRYLRGIILTVRERPKGGPMRKLCIDATNERLAAEETKDDLGALVPVGLIVASEKVDPMPPGYEGETTVNYKTYLGDIYSAAVNENKYSLPPGEYIQADQRLPMKDAGRYVCEPDADGRHGDTFDSGKLAEWALVGTGGAITSMAGVTIGGRTGGLWTPRMRPVQPRM